MSDEPRRSVPHKDNAIHLAKARAARTANAAAKRELLLAAKKESERIESETPVVGSEFAPAPGTPPEEARKVLLEYRQTLRRLLPMPRRALRLTKMAESKDDQLAMKALQMIDNLEGLLAQAKETPAQAPPGPMFLVPEGTDPSRMFDQPVPGDCPYCGRSSIVQVESGQPPASAPFPPGPLSVPPDQTAADPAPVAAG